jgi:hypothetical protein
VLKVVVNGRSPAAVNMPRDRVSAIISVTSMKPRTVLLIKWMRMSHLILIILQT